MAKARKNVQKAPPPPNLPLPGLDVKYCSFTHLRMTQEEAVVAFQSGAEIVAQLAFTPAHLKRLRNALDRVVKAYEKKMGVIDTHETPPSK